MNLFHGHTKIPPKWGRTNTDNVERADAIEFTRLEAERCLFVQAANQPAFLVGYAYVLTTYFEVLYYGSGDGEDGLVRNIDSGIPLNTARTHERQACSNALYL